MFGRRSDGRRIKGVDPIVMLTPYIMPQRVDAQVLTRQELDFDQLTKYIRKQRKEGRNVTYMGVLIAAYLRTLCSYPELNRFIMNKRLYARNHFCVSFVTLKQNENDEVEEALAKVELDLHDTIFDVSARLESIISKTRAGENDDGSKGANATERVARLLLSIPLLPNIVVGLARFLDRYGLMPAVIHNASPFHTGLFISNMASIGMNYIYHHIYNFGTTSVFAAMGKTEQKVYMSADGTCHSKRVMPLGFVIDERIASGGIYARAFGCMKNYINHPELLEVPPEVVRTDIPMRPVPDKRQINV